VLRSGSEAGLQVADVVRELGLPRDQRARVRGLLKELIRRGRVEQLGRRYRLSKSAPATPAISGMLRVTAKGRGVVVLDESTGERVSIDSAELGGALDGDQVAVELTRAGPRARGRVAQVLERGRRRLTGVLESGGGAAGQWRLRPDDPRLAALEVRVKGRPPLAAQQGQVVLAEIEAYPTDVRAPLEVSVSAVLGEAGLLTTEVARVLSEQGVSEAFPPAVMREVASVPDHVRPADLVDRVDLRDRPFITIDPETARDFDDAVTVEPLGDNCTRVWVAVADVSHYVAPGSAIDSEAEARACSIYLPDRAIPMLPEQLSGGICSLVAHRDRLAMVVRLDIDASGRVGDSECLAAVIRSRGRLDYEGVAAAFAGKLRGRLAHYREQLEQLHLLRDLTRNLRRRRLRRGSLDLDLPENKVILDEDDPLRVRDIRPSRPDPAVREAYNLIEELMLAANEAVGRYLGEREVSAIWRIHEPPARDALERLCEGLAAYGVNTAAPEISEPKGMSRLLKQIAPHPAARPLTYLVLRSLKQARYLSQNRGHFGLASPCYLHFTSPIRRYPDLVVHRLLKRQLRQEGLPAGGRRAGEFDPGSERLERVAERASERERVALDVSRQVHSIYAATLMRDRLGDEGEGVVNGLAGFGVFVELAQPRVDGLVRLESLPEAMRFDSLRQQLIGRRSGRTVSLGDPVRVQIAGASVTRRQVDFELLEHEPRQAAPEQRPRQRRASRRERPPGRRRSRR
jgi:ribonuclease R